MELAFGRFGTMASVPWLMVSHRDLLSMSLDSRAGFILSLVDGVSSVEMILDVSGMTRDEALGVLIDLISAGVVALR